LAAEDVEPPFAIGLFGDWGSGKTFFLKKIKNHVEKIAETSRDAISTKPNAFCKTIVQIWFNAWHYVESNLWASLVDNIFRELKNSVKDEDKGKEKYDALMKELKLVQKGADLIREELETAIRSRNIAREKRKQLIKQKISKKKRSIETLKRKVLDEIKDEISHKELIKAAKQIEDLLGIENFEKTVGQVDTTARSLLDFISKAGLLANRTQLLWRSLIAGKIEFSGWKWTLIISSGILILIVGVLLFFKHDKEIWTIITTSVSEAAVVIGAGIAWAKKQLNKASKVVDTIEGIQHRINLQVKEAEVQRRERLTAFNNEIKQLDVEIMEGEKTLQDLEEEVKRIQADINATAPERLVQFIIERAESEDYRKQLGLMAMIREDFENLSDLMEKQKSNGDKKQLNIPKIDRIILYIDDLDRCPPKRVVEVLQAIHLILAFPLFMVVVGVDSRWLSRSLKNRYPFLTLQERNEIENKKPEVYSASTQDYLEKIFQVPYWLKSIDGAQVKDLIQDIIEAEYEEGQEKEKTDNQKKEKQLGQDVRSDDTTEDEQTEYKELEYEAANQHELNLNPRALTISENELTFMGYLGDVVGRTPRTVKRFVNIYRILKASDIRAQSMNFTAKLGAFRFPMLLLAILTGRPGPGQLFFKYLHAADNRKNLKTFLSDLPKTIKSFVTTDKESWDKLLAYLAEFTNKHGQKIKIKDLKDWLPEVTRYGYREWRK
jgi:hypothetical protein